MKEYKIDKDGNGQCYPCMGCRSFLTPWTTKEDLSNSKVKVDSKYYGRFNQGVVTINLVDAGLAAEKDLNRFWQVMDERLELCHKALQLRHERLANTTSDVSPIHWQHGAIARLEKGESIHKLLHDGYSTISLGYAGLWECVYALIGKKLTEPEGEDLGLKIMQLMNDKCAQWKAAENIDYSLYGTPLESTTYKFAKAVQERYGIINGVTDKNLCLLGASLRLAGKPAQALPYLILCSYLNPNADYLLGNIILCLSELKFDDLDALALDFKNMNPDSWSLEQINSL